MEDSYDLNIPDTSTGGFFCRLCLVRTRSRHMWRLHVVGKRHIKNMEIYSNGIHNRQSDHNDKSIVDSFEKPSKIRRYESDWNDDLQRDCENRYYYRRDDSPENKPLVIEYDHKKLLHEEASSPVYNIFDDVIVKENHKDPISKMFKDEKFDQPKTYEEKVSPKQVGRLQENNGSNSKQNKKDDGYEDFVKEFTFILRDCPEFSFSKGNNSKNSINCNKDMYKSTNSKDAFCQEKFEKKISDLLSGRARKWESEDKNQTIKNVDSKNDNSHKSSRKIKTIDHSISNKERDAKDLMRLHRYSKKRRNREEDEDFVDIFHRMNDERLFKIAAAEEVEDNSSVHKSSKTKGSKLENFDPDNLTPDLVDELLSSYLKPKADSSKGKESAKSCIMDLAKKDANENDPNIIAEKLQYIPTKAFFQTILIRLKKIDLQDSVEMKMLMEVISQAHKIIFKLFPPHLQAILKSRCSLNHSKTTSTPVQNPVLPQTNSILTTFPPVSQPVSQPILPTVPEPVLPTVSQPSSKCVPHPLFLGEVKSVSQSVSHMAPQFVQAAASYQPPQTRSPSLNTSNSLQSTIAWQNYLSSMETASKKGSLKPSNGVEATVLYHNFLSDLQTKKDVTSYIPSKTTSKTTSENPKSLNTLPKSKSTLSSPSYSAQAISQTALVSTSEKSSSSSNSAQNRHAVHKYFSLLQAAGSKAMSQTPSNILTKSASASTLNSTQIQSAVKNSKHDLNTVVNTAGIPINPVPDPNQAAMQNYQAYYQQMYAAMYLQRMRVPSANVSRLPSASQAAHWQNLAVYQPNSSLPPYSQFNGAK